MLNIQLGDIVERARKALVLRSRIPFTLDETVVPITIIQDCTQAAYAENPFGFNAAILAAGDGVNAPRMQIRSAAATSTLIIDLLEITTVNAAVQQETYSIFIKRQGAATTGDTAITTRARTNGQSPTTAFPNWRFGWRLAAPPGSAVVCRQVYAPSNQLVSLPCAYVLYPLDELFIATTDVAVASTLSVNVIGREFVPQ